MIPSGKPAALAAVFCLALAPGVARAWDPFWSEDANVRTGNERYAAQDFAGAMRAYRSAEASQRPEVQFNVGLAASALAHLAPDQPPASSSPQSPPVPAQPQDGDADQGAVVPAPPPPAAAVDDDAACASGVRAACHRVAKSAFSRAAAAAADSNLRSRAFYNLGNVYLADADRLAPGPGATLDQIQQMESSELREVIDLYDHAITQYESALVERPGDVDASWNLSYALRRKAELERLEEQKREQEQKEREQENQEQQEQEQQQQEQEQQQQEQEQQQQEQEQQQQEQQEQQGPEQEDQRGDEQDIEQQIRNMMDQEETFQQMQQRQEALEEALAGQRYRRLPPERDW